MWEEAAATGDLPAFLQRMMEILGGVVCFGAAANVFYCHISVTSKKLQDRKGPYVA